MEESTTKFVILYADKKLRVGMTAEESKAGVLERIIANTKQQGGDIADIKTEAVKDKPETCRRFSTDSPKIISLANRLVEYFHELKKSRLMLARAIPTSPQPAILKETTEGAKQLERAYDLKDNVIEEDPKSYLISFHTEYQPSDSILDILMKSISEIGSKTEELNKLAKTNKKKKSKQKIPAGYLGVWDTSNQTLKERVRSDLAEIYQSLNERGVSPEEVYSDRKEGQISCARAVISLFLRSRYQELTMREIGQIVGGKNPISIYQSLKRFKDSQPENHPGNIAEFVDEGFRNYTGRKTQRAA